MDLNEIPKSDQISTKDETFDGKSSPCLDIDVEIRKRMVNLEGSRVSESKRAKFEDEIEGLMKKSGDFEGLKVNEKMGIGDNDVEIRQKMVNLGGRVSESEKAKMEDETEGLRTKNGDFEGFKVNEKMGIGDNDVEIWKKVVNLEGIKVSERERAKIEDEIEGLMKKSGDFEGVKGNEKTGIGDIDDLIMSKVDELMIENKVLECEKIVALKEVEVWKRRCWELELKVFELEGMLGRGASARKGDLVSDGGVPESGGTPSVGSPQNLYASHIGAQSTKMQPSVPVKRQLQFENETGCNRKMTPSTPAGTRSSGVSFHIVVDSDDECNIPAKNGFDLESLGTSKAAPGAHSDGELPIVGTTKRKRDSIVFTSDDEHEVEEVLPRKRIFKVRDRALLRKRIFKVCDSDNDDEGDGVIKPKQPFDSDDECDIPTKDGLDLESKGTSKPAPGAHSDGEPPIVGTSKKKRDPTVFTSDDEHEVEETLPRKRIFKVLNSDNDDEDDDDIKLKQFSGGVKREIDDDEDNIPISQLKMKLCRAMNHSHAQVENADSSTPRHKRRLVKSEQGVKKGRSQETDNRRRNLGVKYVEDDKGEEEYSDSESDCLGSFIVDEDDDDEQDVEDDKSEEDGESGKDDGDASEDSSDDNLDYKDIISRLRRRRSPNTKWDLQGDMLSAFAKDPELCMKAVCVLYRQQTNDEKVCKGSLEQNGRGFSKFDALRGTRLGEFLTGGDPNGDLVKSKEELEEHDRYGLKECVRLANHYSKQLFEIYQNGEDPYFH